MQINKAHIKMKNLPHKHQQMILAHAGLIHSIAMACINNSHRANADAILEAATANGWDELVIVLRRILAGHREDSLINGLDEEDTVITQAILRGIQNPSSLPDPNARPDPAMAAPGIAHMIDAASKGNVEALQLIANMAEMMSRAGGDMARLAASIRPMINGERDIRVLGRGMDEKAHALLTSVLDELQQLNPH